MIDRPISSLDTGIAPLREEGQPHHRIPVLIAGFGKMGTLVAEALEQSADLELLSVALTSERHSGEHHHQMQIGDTSVFLSVQRPDRFPYWKLRLKEDTIVVDYTTADSVEGNAELYIARGLSFVMGTSVGNKERLQRLTEMVRNSNISAVIAANMDPEIVRRQMQIDTMAAVKAGIFAGATVKIREIHQPSKVTVDGTPITSGTAIAFRDQYEGYGALPGGEIESVRDEPDSLCVREAFGDLDLDPQKGYAYHHVVVTDADGNIVDDFETRVIGRGVYVDGTLLAISFLSQRIKEGSRGEVFTMSDVIRDLRRTA